jgi:uncharacterized protein (UPF0335 family)
LIAAAAFHKAAAATDTVNRTAPRAADRARGGRRVTFLGVFSMAEERGEGMGGGQVAADELRLLIERMERLEEEKKGISDDIKDVLAEAKSRGYDGKAIRKILQIRKKKKEEYQEEEAILEVYMQALGMI